MQKLSNVIEDTLGKSQVAIYKEIIENWIHWNAIYCGMVSFSPKRQAAAINLVI